MHVSPTEQCGIARARKLPSFLAGAAVPFTRPRCSPDSTWRPGAIGVPLVT
jgi:hypothetical protein